MNKDIVMAINTSDGKEISKDDGMTIDEQFLE